ncbi:hypothetical protein C7974DRAFT_378566 [Boeremia exigua]|uniref:uncharacterized protein n=1 Tax=Boeremia exigua TaxID=749465 RepID=UPI001E8EA3FD|nr:uncharacterized protein C7974DRAFT_378566 [Boeremia exigua]KAH6620540.1 hypothetical protein C7974DRAFT_378566 [Boeremia exigua]
MVMWWECDAVYCGFWNNEGNSFVHRGTLTLPNQWGLILGSFFTFFIAVASSYLWGTISFTIHQLNASSSPQDDSYHQLQVILRNTESQGSFMNQLSRLVWVHRDSRTKSYTKSIILILFAAVFQLGLSIAGVFSTRIVAAPDTSVLSVSSHCGWFEELTVKNSSAINFLDYFSVSGIEFHEYVNAATVMMRTVLRKNAAYSRSCYERSGDNSTVCGNLVRPTLPYTITRDVACPFEQRACNGAGFSLDTGLLRSDTDLGLNTRPEDALSIRKVLTCAPLAGENYTVGWQPLPPEIAANMDLPGGTQVKSYEFGSYLKDTSGTNSTFVVDELDWKRGKQPYGIGLANSILDLPYNPVYVQFTPIPDILNTSADFTVVELTNRMDYAVALEDPWFRADNCTETPGQLPPVLCTASNPASFLGCQEQYQFCKPGPTPPEPESCTPLTGLFKLFPDLFLNQGALWNGTSLPNLTPAQTAVHYLLGKTLASSQLHWQLVFIGHENLIAQDFLWDGGFGFDMSATLPPNQWHTEVMNWMNTSLATIQRGIPAYARHSPHDLGSPDALARITAPADAALQSLCTKVRVHSAAHTSFSLVAMAAVLVAGAACILSDLVAHKLFGCVQRRSGHGVYKSREWDCSSALQLQRLAAEGRGVGPWEGRDGEVPRLVERGRRFRLVGDGGLGGGTSYEPGYGDGGGRYRALAKHGVQHGEVELRSIPG